MTEDLQHRLADAVKLLTEARTEYTTITDDDGTWLRVEAVEHPSLLEQLIKGTGAASGAGGSGSGIPIDADALEMVAQIRDTLRQYAIWLPFEYTRDLELAVQNWAEKTSDWVRDGHMSDEAEHDATRYAESWVRQIQSKFEPDKIIDWTDPCYSCGNRRIEVDELERFAIRINLTQKTADCAGCGKKWTGLEELKQLRYLTNVANDTPTETEVPTR